MGEIGAHVADRLYADVPIATLQSDHALAGGYGRQRIILLNGKAVTVHALLLQAIIPETNTAVIHHNFQRGSARHQVVAQFAPVLRRAQHIQRVRRGGFRWQKRP